MAELKPDPAVPVWIVFGDAGPLVDEAVARVVEAGLSRCGLPAFNHSTWSAADVAAVAAVSTARTLPMMADLRVVVVRDLEEGHEAVLEALADYVAEPSPSTLLVATGTGFPRARKGGRDWGARIRNAAKKTGQVLKYGRGDVAPARFVADEAVRAGKRIGRTAAELVVELAGDDLSRLRREVEKLSLYVGDAEEIEVDDVHGACSAVAAAVVWELTAGIATRDADRALASLHRQLEEGEDPRKILGLIGWQLRQLLQAAELVRLGAPDKEVSRQTRIRWDQLGPLKAAVKAGRAPRAADTLGKLATANRLMNEHRAGDRRILEALVLDLCGVTG